MLSRLNIKKEYLLIAASILALLVAYQVAFKKTIEAWQLHSDLKRQISQSTDLGYQPGYLERKNANLDKIIKLYKADTNNYRSIILSDIVSIAEQEKVKLSQVPTQDAVYHSSQFLIQKLSFEGDFFSLIRTINRLSVMRNIGFVRSVGLKSQRAANYNQSERIVMDISFQIVNQSDIK